MTKPTRATLKTEKTTINLPKELKLRAKMHALKSGKNLQDLIADGLRLVLARDGGKARASHGTAGRPERAPAASRVSSSSAARTAPARWSGLRLCKTPL